MNNRNWILLVATLIAGAVFFVFRPVPSKKQPNAEKIVPKWEEVSVSDGPLRGRLKFRVEEHGDRMTISKWEPRMNYPWFDGFRAAKGMSSFAYADFIKNVSSEFIDEIGLNENKFNEMKNSVPSTVAPDYTVFYTVYLACSLGEYAFVSCWNNRGEKKIDVAKRLEADGKTKYKGSWVHLRRDHDRFVLSSITQLQPTGVLLFPYDDQLELNALRQAKSMAWNSSENKYEIK